MNGAECIIYALQINNIKTVFGYPGGAIMPLYDALYNAQIEHILCRHEQAAAMAAIGYARSTGCIGVCIATSGPGATNLITGIADAMADSIPIIAITGQVPLSLIGTDAFQETDIIGMSLGCTKHSFLIKSPSEICNTINKACIIALSNRPGPVLIDIPKDIQLAKNIAIDYNNKYANSKNNKIINCINSNIIKANKLIEKSSMPILYIGGGVNISNAIIILRTFINYTKIPTVVTLKGLGTICHTYQYYLGMLGMHGNKAANYAVQQCDLLIAVGARFDDRVTGNTREFAPNAKIIHIDIDDAEINKICLVDIALLGDVKDIIPLLSKPINITVWQKYIIKLKKKYSWIYNVNYNINNKIYAPIFLNKLSNMLKKNTIITTDVGQHQMWVAQHMFFSHPRKFITSSGLGTMGFGLPAAIGAQIAYPDDQVICISGDGSFVMNIQELSTIKRKKLPIKIVLLDNKRLGMVRQWQQIFFNKRYSETILWDNPNFIVLASAFGIDGCSINKFSEIDNGCKQMLSTQNAYILHVTINEHDNVWPLVPPGKSNDHMIEQD
ncbi:acetolactate synthase 2 catalytic subunit [Enterobacteriaceae endosymbiont of Neohaemonia nigricornis]|uniref:acetolactate synthase 2 catalytic subunit n=1 Tax=Enterobacteriaceae endosymbiont of Neohaemonia nigricornis TaxID=2675792 RepID=UPI001449C8CD|nr:acetolactate synthase 2 catalytic subunit [Enterobacteriaceae endosymbiont of Neohaemonia nigricornis]QJC30382.1 acetolactate synthase 2 catalytic subunit [Enterobacteriaceae endosymbiont of Neohaemonia nigricornis]